MSEYEQALQGVIKLGARIAELEAKNHPHVAWMASRIAELEAMLGRITEELDDSARGYGDENDHLILADEARTLLNKGKP